MPTDTRHVLHTIHTATNDILSGYDTMVERAEPEILPTVRDLQRMHREHAAAQANWLSRFAESGEDDESFQGSVNQAVVTIRDWITGLDENALSAVRDGEQKLLDVYDSTMTDWTVDGDADISDGLTRQFAEIEDKVAALPAR